MTDSTIMKVGEENDPDTNEDQTTKQITTNTLEGVIVPKKNIKRTYKPESSFTKLLISLKEYYMSLYKHDDSPETITLIAEAFLNTTSSYNINILVNNTFLTNYAFIPTPSWVFDQFTINLNGGEGHNDDYGHVILDPGCIEIGFHDFNNPYSGNTMFLQILDSLSIKSNLPNIRNLNRVQIPSFRGQTMTDFLNYNPRFAMDQGSVIPVAVNLLAGAYAPVQPYISDVNWAISHSRVNNAEVNNAINQLWNYYISTGNGFFPHTPGWRDAVTLNYATCTFQWWLSEGKPTTLTWIDDLEIENAAIFHPVIVPSSLSNIATLLLGLCQLAGPVGYWNMAVDSVFDDGATPINPNVRTSLLSWLTQYSFIIQTVLLEELEDQEGVYILFIYSDQDTYSLMNPAHDFTAAQIANRFPHDPSAGLGTHNWTPIVLDVQTSQDFWEPGTIHNAYCEAWDYMVTLLSDDDLEGTFKIITNLSTRFNSPRGCKRNVVYNPINRNIYQPSPVGHNTQTDTFWNNTTAQRPLRWYTSDESDGDSYLNNLALLTEYFTTPSLARSCVFSPVVGVTEANPNIAIYYERRVVTLTIPRFDHNLMFTLQAGWLMDTSPRSHFLRKTAINRLFSRVENARSTMTICTDIAAQLLYGRSWFEFMTTFDPQSTKALKSFVDSLFQGSKGQFYCKTILQPAPPTDRRGQRNHDYNTSNPVNVDFAICRENSWRSKIIQDFIGQMVPNEKNVYTNIWSIITTAYQLQPQRDMLAFALNYDYFDKDQLRTMLVLSVTDDGATTLPRLTSGICQTDMHFTYPSGVVQERELLLGQPGLSVTLAGINAFFGTFFSSYRWPHFFPRKMVSERSNREMWYMFQSIISANHEVFRPSTIFIPDIPKVIKYTFYTTEEVVDDSIQEMDFTN